MCSYPLLLLIPLLTSAYVWVASLLALRCLKRRPLVVCIEGTIAVGKSTVCDGLRAAGWVVFAEGADDWNRWRGALECFYTDPPRWSFLLQASILDDMRRIYDRIMTEHREERIVFVERSPLSAKIFVDNSRRAGHLTDLEGRTYDRLHSQLGWVPDVIISLECPADTTIRRLRERSREAELGVDEDYLRTMDSCYRRRVARWRGAVASGRLRVREVVSVDASQPRRAVLADVRRIAGRL